LRVLADVANDIGQLKRDAEVLGVVERARVAVAKMPAASSPTTPAT
jgi:hypothetical protein